MINLSELRVIEDTFFKTSLTYYEAGIYELFEKYFKEENEYSEATDIKLKNVTRANSDMAFDIILKEDIKKLQSSIKETPKQFDEQLWRDMLPKIRMEVKKNLGMDFKPRPVFFEDKFPAGLIAFEKKGASSVTIFEGQKDAGIYFLNKRVSSFFTPILIIHEQLHSCLSQNKNKQQMYIEWFEEGLCQWYSLKIYYELTKNFEVLEYYKKRCYVYSKVKDEHNFTRRYFEYMKIFSRLYLNGGQKLLGKILVDYISNNRDKVNKYLDIEPEIKNLPQTKLENFLVNFSVQIEPEKLSPVEYLVLKESINPIGIEKLSKKTKINENLLKKIVLTLNFYGMIVIKEEKVEINWRKKDLIERGLIKPYWPLNN
ncbi:MAG: hypothetical protein AABW92_02310 [Nanoarchaeota archaeon]